MVTEDIRTIGSFIGLQIKDDVEGRLMHRPQTLRFLVIVTKSDW